MVQLVLTERQAEVLKDILDFWIDGMDPATKDVQDDRTHDTAEEMLGAISTMHDIFADIVQIRSELLERLPLRQTQGEE